MFVCVTVTDDLYAVRLLNLLFGSFYHGFVILEKLF